MKWTSREVLDRLLGIVCGGIRQALRSERVIPLPSLVNNTCLLLSAVVAELSSETIVTDVNILCSEMIKITTNEIFRRMICQLGVVLCT